MCTQSRCQPSNPGTLPHLGDASPSPLQYEPQSPRQSCGHSHWRHPRLAKIPLRATDKQANNHNNVIRSHHELLNSKMKGKSCVPEQLSSSNSGSRRNLQAPRLRSLERKPITGGAQTPRKDIISRDGVRYDRVMHGNDILARKDTKRRAVVLENQIKHTSIIQAAKTISITSKDKRKRTTLRLGRREACTSAQWTNCL